MVGASPIESVILSAVEEITIDDYTILADGDFISAGAEDASGFFAEINGGGVLKTVRVIEEVSTGTLQKSDCRLILFTFNDTPASTNDPFVIGGSTTIEHLIAEIDIAAGDYEEYISGELAVATKQVDIPVWTVGNTCNLYFVLVSSGTKTYTANHTITIGFDGLSAMKHVPCSC